MLTEHARLSGLSARNQISGKIQTIRKGAVVAEVIVDCAGQALVATITCDSVDRLQLEVGTEVHAIIKASDIMISR